MIRFDPYAGFRNHATQHHRQRGTAGAVTDLGNLAFLQAGLLLSTGSQLFNQEQSKIRYHFRRLDGTLQEQDHFLRQWRLHDVGSRGQPVDESASRAPPSPL